MTDTTVKKIHSADSPTGEMGQKYLATGKRAALRLWKDEPPGAAMPTTRRDYETLGYVIAGRAELHIEGQMVKLEPGDSWLVPQGAEHTYRILETFTAIEATSPPAHVHGRDRLPDDGRTTAGEEHPVDISAQRDAAEERAHDRGYE